MKRIVRVIAAPAVGGYYVEDLAALQAQPIPVPQRYTALPLTPGFRHVREVAEAISVGLVMEDTASGSRRIAWGDCVGVAYGGKAGRDPVFRAREGLTLIRQGVAPLLEGRELSRFRDLAAEIDTQIEALDASQYAPEAGPNRNGTGLSRRDLLTSPANLLRALRQEVERGLAPSEPVLVRRAHTAIRYGISQALLQAIALGRGLSMAEVVAEEWSLPPPDQPIPIHAQSGRERYHNADKMIVRRVTSLPHALVDDIPEQLGEDGGKLVQYVHRLRERIQELGDPDYRPFIHLDVHGALGTICANEPGRILGRLYALEMAAKPYPLRVESPVIMGSRMAQIEMMRTLRSYIRARRMTVQLVVDEWAESLADIRAFIEAQAADMIQIKTPDLGGVHNTVEAVLACKTAGVGALLGGSCAETDLSARVTAHVALATRPDLVMAKPGMGVDEGIMLMHNEMVRTLTEIGVMRTETGTS